MKKYIISILCVAMLLGILPTNLFSINVNAAEGPIGLNEIKTVTVEREQIITYEFTPEEDGEYVLWMEQPAGAIMGIQLAFYVVGAENSEEIKAYQENYQAQIYHLKAGKTYDVVVRNGANGALTRNFGICKTSTATGMSFGSVQPLVYAGGNEVAWLILSSPDAVAGTFTWNSSNPEVVSVEVLQKTSARLHYLSAGTATITVTNGTTSCSYTVTVQSLPALHAGGTVSFGPTLEAEYIYEFTPSVSGRYKIYTNHMYGIGIEPNDNNTEVIINDGSQGIACELAAGYTYRFTVWVTTLPYDNKVDVTTELLDAHGVATPSSKPSFSPNAGGSISSDFTPPQGQWSMDMELDQEYAVNTEDYQFIGNFTPEENGIYYVVCESEFSGSWYVIHEGEAIEPESIQTDGQNMVEMKYYFEAGKLYEITGGEFYLNDDRVWVSQISAELKPPQEEPDNIPDNAPGEEPSDEPDNAPDIPMNPDDGAVIAPPSVDVTEHDFFDQVQNMESGWMVRVDISADEGIGLDKVAFMTAAERDVLVEVVMNAATLTFDKKTMETMSLFFTTDHINFIVNQLSEDELTQEQKTGMAEFQVEYLLQAEIYADDQILHDFEGGNTTVRIPFEGVRKGMAFEVIYLAEDGSIEHMETRVGDGYIEFDTGHFSTFAVVSLEGDSVEGDGMMNGGKGIIAIGCVIAVAVIAVGTIIILKKK